jgi:hypothetical protein
MNKIIKLARIIKDRGLYDESEWLISLGSGIKRLQLAERPEVMTIPEAEDIRSINDWMLTVAAEVSEILGVHTPAFLGSSGRNLYGRGAYAFSVSNDEGKSRVLKIGLAGELEPYKKIKERFGDKPPSILPVIYQAASFDEIGYEPPPSGLRNSFGVILMEELVPMPPNMAEFLQNRGGEEESFRILKDSGSELVEIINSSAEKNRSFLEFQLRKMKLSDKEAEDKAGELLMTFKEEVFFGLKKATNLVSGGLNPGGKDLYTIIREISTPIFGGHLKKQIVEEVADGFTRILLMKLSDAPADSEYNLNTALGKHFRKSIRELEDLGIDPRDLHADNIMLRPETYEIVISDLGHFHV